MPEPHPGRIEGTTSKGQDRKASTSEVQDMTPTSDRNDTDSNDTAVPAEATATRNTGQSKNRTTREEVPMSTKTTSTPTAAELSRLALAQARDILTDAERAAESHQADAEELDLHLTSGQADAAGLDSYVTRWQYAQAAAAVTAKLVEGAQANVKRAEHALINDDVVVADLFAEVVSEVYGGRLPIRVVTVASQVKPNENGDPVLFIVQPRAGQNNAGILRANLELTFFRPPLFAELDGRKIEEACRERGYAVEVGMWSSIDHGAFYEDPARVRVARIYSSVPTLSQAPENGEVSLFVGAVRNRLRYAISYFGEREEVHLMYEPVEGRARVEVVSYSVISQIKHQGDNRLTVEAVYSVHPDSMLIGEPVAAMMEEAIRKEVGNMADGLGRVVSIDHIKVDVPDLARRFGDAEPFVVTAHFGILYRLG